MARYAKFFSVGGGGGGTNNLQLPVGTILDTTLRQVQDGLGTGSPLYLSTYRVGITSDASVTTQTSSVIQSSTTNANLVIAPNGTGALVADIPDGAATGGNARSTNAVDLQMSRLAADQIARGDYSSIVGGGENTTIGTYSIAGGRGNFVTGTYAIGLGYQNNSQNSGTVAFGWQNAATSAYSTISGGQSNTASTNTHATVVGGQSNTASGQYSVAGGNSNTASGNNSVALGNTNNAASRNAIAIGANNTVNTIESYSLGNGNTSSSTNGFTIGSSNIISTANSNFAIGFSNTANSANGFSIALGSLSVANEQYSTALGLRSKTSLYGQVSNSSGLFLTNGDAQQSLLTARREADLTTAATTVLSLDGTGVTNLIIPSGNNRAWNVQVNWVAVVTTITGTATGVTVGDIITGESLFGFKKIGGVSSVRSFIRDSQGADTAIMDTCSLAYSAGASQELAMTFTGPTFAGGGSVTMRVVAKVQLVEVAY